MPKMQTRNKTNGHIKPRPKSSTYHIKLPSSVLLKIRKQAEAGRRTVHAHIAMLVERAVEAGLGGDRT